jgi:hypothetical protein
MQNDCELARVRDLDLAEPVALVKAKIGKLEINSL